METIKNISTKLFRKIHAEFDRMILAKGYKTGDGNMYQTAVQELLIWMEQNNCTTLLEINSTTIENYYEYLIRRTNKRRNGTLSDATINHHLFGLRLFVDHLWFTKQITHLVMVPKNHAVEKMQTGVVTLNEIKLLYCAANTSIETALLSLAYGCGLRRQELCQLNLIDINFRQNKLLVRSGKGNKTREIPLADSVRYHLREYAYKERITILQRKGKFFPQFFISTNGNPTSGTSLNDSLKKIVLRTKNLELINKNISLHSLRHAIATHLSENGAEIEFVRDFLGHDSVDTSSLYMIRRKRKTNYSI